MANPFGTRVRAARCARGISLRELARRIDASPTWVSRCECAVEDWTPPSEDVIRRIADTVDISADELMHLAGRVPADVEQIVIRDPGMPAAIRAARDAGIGGADLLRMIAEVRRG